MTREDIWLKAFETELSDYDPSLAAISADNALAEYDKRFPARTVELTREQMMDALIDVAKEFRTSMGYYLDAAKEFRTSMGYCLDEMPTQETVDEILANYLYLVSLNFNVSVNIDADTLAAPRDDQM
jgi:hypothetical protein